MTGQELAEALAQVKRDQDVVDRQAEAIARLLVGRLRLLGRSYSNFTVLRAFKAELTRFDSRSGRWRD